MSPPCATTGPATRVAIQEANPARRITTRGRHARSSPRDKMIPGSSGRSIVGQRQAISKQGDPDRAAVVGQVESPGLAVEAVVDEAVGEVQEEVPPHRGD